jgi:hypothetical protein
MQTLEFLDKYNYKIGENFIETTLQLNMYRLTEHHETAKYEVDLLEDIGESESKYIYIFSEILNIKDFIHLSNFREQIDKVKSYNLDVIHLHNLIYLAQQNKRLYGDLYEENLATYSELLERLDFTYNLALSLSKGTDNIEITLLKGTMELCTSSLSQNLSIEVSHILLEHFANKILIKDLQVINELLDQEKTEDDFRYSDLASIAETVRNNIKLNTSLLKYIRIERILSNDPLNGFENPNSNEARLMYVVMCLTNQHSILVTDKVYESPRVINLNNQNDRIIGQMKKMYKDLTSTAFFDSVKSSKLLELYLFI